MRLRKKKNLNKRMEKVSSYLVADPSGLAGKWGLFSGGKPIRLEIGCGKGKFICETALADPDIFHVALEKVPDVLVMAMEKAAAAGIGNIRFICANASKLSNFFSEGEVERIYLNFSDPWPSNRHRKRRLTSENFLDIYRRILSPEGSIFLKTDNSDFFDFSVNELTRCGFTLKNVTRDLHADAGTGFNPEGGAVSEYEERFHSSGIPIHRLEAYRFRG